MLRSPARAHALLALGGFLCALAACTADGESPTEPSFRLPVPGVAVCYAECQSPVPEEGVWDSDHPELIPPVLENGAYVATLIDQWFPSTVYRPLVRGTAQVWIRVESSGAPVDVRLRTALGRPPLDSLIVKAATAARFSPPLLHGEPTPLWVSMPITF